MKRILGLDLGSKTLGVANSDITQTVANKLGTLVFEPYQYNQALKMLDALIKDEKYEKIVLGLPKNMDGSIGGQAQESLNFKTLLEEKYQTEVILWDERLTTKIAHSSMIMADLSRKKRKKKVDYIAATLILQGYLDSRKRV